MKILVTGGAGFIGSHIVDRYIELGHDVDIFDNLSSGLKENINPKATFHEIDINDKAIFPIIQRAGYDVISHQAAQMSVRFSLDYPQFDAQNNIIGTINLMEAARRYGVTKVIFASSGGTVYGEQQTHPCDEDHPLLPLSPYGITKVACEKYLHYYKQVYGIDSVVYRYGNVFGARQNPKGEAGVIAIFTGKMLGGEQPIINGDGKTTRDYIYIKDIVNANELALDESVSGTFNVTTGIETNTNQIFHLIKDILKSDIEEHHGPAIPGEPRRSVCSNEKLMRQGWRIEVSLAEGMRRSIEYYKTKQQK